MPQLTVSADIYEKLARQAATRNLTVEQLVTSVLEEVAGAEVENGHQPRSAADVPYDQWKARFDEFLAAVRSRAGRYPPGFQADVGRERIYEGCGE